METLFHHQDQSAFQNNFSEQLINFTWHYKSNNCGLGERITLTRICEITTVAKWLELNLLYWEYLWNDIWLQQVRSGDKETDGEGLLSAFVTSHSLAGRSIADQSLLSFKFSPIASSILLLFLLLHWNYAVAKLLTKSRYLWHKNSF